MPMSLSDERLSFKISQSNKILSIDEWQSNSWEQIELFERQIKSDAITILFLVLSEVNRTAKLNLLDWLSNGNVDENLTSTCATWQWSMQRLLIYWYLLDQMIELRQAICIITQAPVQPDQMIRLQQAVRMNNTFRFMIESWKIDDQEAQMPNVKIKMTNVT